MMQYKKVIVFDFDGVIIDNTNLIYEEIKFDYSNLSLESFKKIFNKNFLDGLNEFRNNNSIYFKDSKKVNYIAENDPSIIFAGIKELIHVLSLKYILVINSTSEEANISFFLKKNEILNYFNFIAGKEVSTDKIEKFDLIIKKFNVSRDEAVFVTDTIGDVFDSDKSCIDSVAVTWGVHSRSDFSKFKFNQLLAVVDTPEELLGLFL